MKMFHGNLLDYVSTNTYYAFLPSVTSGSCGTVYHGLWFGSVRSFLFLTNLFFFFFEMHNYSPDESDLVFKRRSQVLYLAFS